MGIFSIFKSKKKREAEALLARKQAREEDLIDSIEHMDNKELRQLEARDDYSDYSYKVREAVRKRRAELRDNYQRNKFYSDQESRLRELRAERDSLERKLNPPIKDRSYSDGYGFTVYLSSTEIEELKRRIDSLNRQINRVSKQEFEGW